MPVRTRSGLPGGLCHDSSEIDLFGTAYSGGSKGHSPSFVDGFVIELVEYASAFTPLVQAHSQSNPQLFSMIFLLLFATEIVSLIIAPLWLFDSKAINKNYIDSWVLASLMETSNPTSRTKAAINCVRRIFWVWWIS